jgi:hypothetical protein
MKEKHRHSIPISSRFITSGIRRLERTTLPRFWHCMPSPLVSHLLNKEEGICRGKGELKRFFETLAPRKPKARQFYRTGYFTNGRTIMWEYPHDTPRGEQMDFVEVMEIENGLIQKYRVYWSWSGFGILKRTPIGGESA